MFYLYKHIFVIVLWIFYRNHSLLLHRFLLRDHTKSLLDKLSIILLLSWNILEVNNLCSHLCPSMVYLVGKYTIGLRISNCKDTCKCCFGMIRSFRLDILRILRLMNRSILLDLRSFGIFLLLVKAFLADIGICQY